MNGAVLLGVGLVLFFLGYVFYGKILKKIFGIEPDRPCPSHTLRDDVDFCPTPMPVLFGHHFASIAGAGPIVGPVLAVYLGWGPAILWIILGCIFIGSMHDFAAMFLSVRNKGRSIAYVIQNELGYIGRQIFLVFCLAALVLVVAVFSLQVAQSFIATPSVATASILFILMAPAFGVGIGRKIVTLAEGSMVFVPLLFVCVWLGTVAPLDLVAVLGSRTAALNVWMLILLYYAATASIIPVWVLLQPRDYLNSYLLYTMMFIGIAGIFCAAPELGAPMFAEPAPGQPGAFPLLFVTIACGACSGFHALVASGTSSKQIDKETHIFPVGYGAMLVEGVLAIVAVVSICYLNPVDFKAMIGSISSGQIPPAGAFAQGLAHFAVKLHIPYEFGLTFISLAISAFMLTSLDTATRLCRFVWQELVLPPTPEENKPETAQAKPCKIRNFLASRWVATACVVIMAGWLALSGNGTVIWPVFGASNQLLAALTLLAITLWLMRTKRPVLFAMLPMLFMLFISIWALITLIGTKLKALSAGIDAGKVSEALHTQGTLLLFSFVLLILAAWLVFLGAKKMLQLKKQR